MDITELDIDTPSTLQVLCTEIVLTHIDYIADKSTDSQLQLKPGLKLSLPLCEKLMQGLHEMMMLTVETLSLFRDNTRTRLKCLNLSELCSNDAVTDPIIQDLLKHKPHEIKISGFEDEASLQTLETLYSHSDNLTSLCVGPNIASHLANLTKNFPKLRSLGLRHVNKGACLKATDNPHRLVCLLEDIASLGHQLVHLDFSFCDIKFAACDFSKLHNVRSLILHGVYINKQQLSDAVKAISRLNNLRLLDLSVANEEGPYLYDNPGVNMRNLLENLPLLTHLDISGTNLAGCGNRDDIDDGVSSHAASDVSRKCGIPGLEERHLNFLGLMNCQDNPCERTNIPANMITGHFTEEQVLLSVQTYTDRGGHLLSEALHNLFELSSHGTGHNMQRELYTLLNALTRHPMDSGIQINGSVCLFNIVSDLTFRCQNTHLHRRIVRVLIAAMETHNDKQGIFRNSSRIIQYMYFPKDALPLLHRFVQVLLGALLLHKESTTRNECIYTLEFIIYQLNDKEMQIIAGLATTEVLLKVIKELVTDKVCDYVMTTAWRILWHTTDENWTTSQRFVDNEGMKIFYQCYQTFPATNKLLELLAGVLSNVAENPALRSHLVTSKYVTAFSHMLGVGDDTIEISYFTCTTLAHMISDGPSAWTIETPTRESVLKEMTTAINRWHLKARLRAYYSSLEPFLRLLKPGSDLHSHHCVVWAICNLTINARSKYCPMVEQEGGLELLERVSQNVTHCDTVRHLAKEVIDRCARFQEDPDWRSDDEE